MLKNLPANAGDAGDEGSLPGLGRSPGRGNGNILQYSCPQIPRTEEAGGLQSMGFAKSQTQGRTHVCPALAHKFEVRKENKFIDPFCSS